MANSYGMTPILIKLLFPSKVSMFEKVRKKIIKIFEI